MVLPKVFFTISTFNDTERAWVASEVVLFEASKKIKLRLLAFSLNSLSAGQSALAEAAGQVVLAILPAAEEFARTLLYIFVPLVK